MMYCPVDVVMCCIHVVDTPIRDRASDSVEVLCGGNVVSIARLGRLYRLHATKQGKLILTQ